MKIQFLLAAAMALFSLCPSATSAGAVPDGPFNLAGVAIPSTSFVSGHESLAALDDGFDPSGENDSRHGHYGNWPSKGTQWVCYTWDKPVSTAKIDVYWWADGRGVRLPKASRLSYWDGAAFVPVKDAAGLGLDPGKFNTTSFPEITTTKLRLEFDGTGDFSTGILEWKVYDSGKSPKFAPKVQAGHDRTVVAGRPTWLGGTIKNGAASMAWSKRSGPGEVTFENAGSADTTAVFSCPGAYVLQLAASAGEGLEASDTLRVEVTEKAQPATMKTVFPSPYTLDSPLWNDRAKALICRWIPHCIEKLSDPGVKEGGIRNFIEAGNKNAGKPYQPHAGAPWANAYVLNTYESICMALMVQPGANREMVQAQAGLRKTLEEWTPMLLAAQEKDGYLQTRFTLGTEREQAKLPQRWSIRSEHEGYVGGYFIEACIAHYLLSDGTDTRMLDAAVRLADCWDRHIGPAPKQAWHDGHQEIEQALVRLARILEQKDGAGAGQRYIALAKFLLDQRGGGDSYDQSHGPVTQQNEALGHAVRAVYTYNAMADIAMETGDADYQGAVESLWSNLIHRKYYVTGGVGSGETPEGFGADYSLPLNAYCESCSGCGELFFQHKMNLWRQDAKYVNLLEETLYNAILGSMDLRGDNFTYTNALDSSEKRYGWHVCPCCIGNIPRVLLMLPEWTYARGPEDLYVNLFIGGTMRVKHVAGTNVEMVQKTDYPWSGDVAITVNPAAPTSFALRVRVPQRDVSDLYRSAPSADGIGGLKVNGESVRPVLEKGYAVIKREWKPGDKVEFVLPMPVQRVKCSDAVAANRGRVAIRRGPLVYSTETADHQNPDAVLDPAAPLTSEWSPGTLGGVVLVKGKSKDGKEMTAIPNYARLNRGGRSLVWLKDE